ncbi:alpha/beta hydrolase family protein [Leuconostoc mesenteroides]|uniref:alpha/beta hydrolase family protein n=1 Tax=Leuconostoc TaxID=1243 RepID=UPI00345D0D6D
MPLSASDLFALQTFSRPVAIPGGVVVVKNWLDQDQDAYHHRLQVFGRTDLHFGHDQKHDTAPQLAPDHTHLAWLSQVADGTTQVFAQNFHGVALQRTWLANGVTQFFWASDSLGFWVQTTLTPTAAQTRPTKLTRLHFHANGQELRREDQTVQLWHQGLTPADCKLVYQSHTHYQLRAVTKTHLVAQAESTTRMSNGAPATTVFLIDPMTGATTPQFTGNATVQDAKGDTLLLSGDPDNDAKRLTTTLFTYHDGELTPLLADRDVEVGNHVMSDTQMNPSGRIARFAHGGVVFTYSHQGEAYLGQTQGGGAFTTFKTPHGAVCDFDLAVDDTPWFTHSDHTTVSALYHGEAKLAETLSDWPAQAPEAFSFNQGGLTIQGWYYRPAGDHKHPALLSVHGGPHAAYGNSYFHELQTYRAAGFGVIALNPRGSATYGQAFLAAGIGDYGGGDFADLLAGVEQAKQLDANIDQLFLTGGSYGGFIANWAETHSQAFSGIVSERAISNWVSFYGTSDIGYYYAPRELGDSDLANMWRQSPLAAVDAAITPILLIHSEQDLRVPMGQAEEFYTALQLRGVNATLWRFPNSNHDLSRTGLPSLRYIRLQGSLEWLQHLVKGE